MAEITQKTKPTQSDFEQQDINKRSHDEYQKFMKVETEKIFYHVNTLCKKIYKEFIGPEGAKKNLRSLNTDFEDLDNADNFRMLAYYDNYYDNSITFCPDAYKLFSAMKKFESERNNKMYEKARLSLDITIGHELGHALLDSIEHDIIAKDPQGFPFYLPYRNKDRSINENGRKVHESIAQAVGIYVSQVLRDLPTDNASLSAFMLERTKSNIGRAAELYDNIMHKLDTYNKLEALELERRVNSDWETVIVYEYPRVGAAKAWRTSSIPTESFIKDAFAHAANFEDMNRYALDEDGHMTTANGKFARADLKTKMAIAASIFKEISDA